MSSQKLLVANRSEIACRVFQCCREMEIETVSLVVKGDEQARHVSFADEVIEVSSYLEADEIIEKAKKLGVTLIHPGYGFLSERPHFAKAVERAGMIFVGPRAETMELMGGKITAKDLAEKIGVPTLPWARVDDIKEIEGIARKIGFPLLIKAAAGGGGKGMRKVLSLGEVHEAAQRASSEAKSSFGDGALFLERFLERPRHIEVQVFGDGKGGGVHLFERECSLQRRHQKVWEEAPAPNLSENTRQGLWKAALSLVKETKYRSAGTVEFLVDGEEFFFLEMNTRLQVEHPVTEEVTGVDLVRWQILQAVDSKFKFEQPDVINAHSIEVRIYAEDPFQSFMPTPGRVDALKWPTGTGIRVESGIEKNQTVGTGFDPMLAKLIVKAPTREIALKRMQFAIEETFIGGMNTNLFYLHQISKDQQVIKGDVYTNYLENEFKNKSFAPTEEEADLIAAILRKGIGKKLMDSPSEGDPLLSPWFEVEAGT